MSGIGEDTDISDENENINILFRIKSGDEIVASSNGNEVSGSSIALDDSIQLWWRVKNISEDPVRITGYYCPLFKKINSSVNKKGVFDKHKQEFRDDKFYIRKERVRVHLHQEELRTYVWDQVPLWYYGIREPGEWAFELEIEYNTKNNTEYERSPKLWFTVTGEGLDTLQTSDKLHDLLTEENLRNRLPQQFREISSAFDDEKSKEFNAGRIGNIDYLAKLPDGPVVIEAKVTANPKTVYQVKRYVEWAKNNLSYQFGNNVYGIIIASEFENFTRRDVENYQERDNIVLVKYSGPEEPLNEYTPSISNQH
jgi:hypothetical protein